VGVGEGTHQRVPAKQMDGEESEFIFPDLTSVIFSVLIILQNSTTYTPSNINKFVYKQDKGRK
jgi:hypothetical protein